MGLFDRKESGDPGEEEPIQVNLYTPQMLVKRLLWDSVACDQVETLLTLMKLPPDSEDVRDMEHRESHRRVEDVLPLQEILALLVPLVAGITSSAMLVNSGTQADEETALQLHKHHSMVIRTGVVAILANLLDMGFITHAEGIQVSEQLLG